MRQDIPTYLLYGETRTETHDFWLHCETIASRSRTHHWRIKPHRHANFLQILHIAAGHGRAEFDGETHPIPTPGLVVIPETAVHGFRFSRDIEGHVITVIASRARPLLVPHPALAEWAARPRIVDAGAPADGDFLARSVDRFAAEYEARQSGRGLILENLLVAIMVVAHRLGTPETAAYAEIGGEAGLDPRVAQTLALISDHFREPRTVRFYADRAGVTATHLNRLTRQATGSSVNELVARRRVAEAKRSLVFTVQPVQTIAFSLGFSDPAYFSRFFQQRTGRTPLAYRKAERAAL